MKIKLLTLLALLAVFPFGAKAATIVDLGAYAYSIDNAAAAPAGNVDLNALNESWQFLYHNYGSVSSNITNLTVINGGIATGTGSTLLGHNYTQPWGISGDDHYLTVFGMYPNGFGIPGTATFSFTEGVTSFSFIWGSIDTYNLVEVSNYAGANYTITGADLLTALGLNPGTTTGTLTEYFTLTDLAGIKSIVLRSCYDAFEVANISAVPLPAAALLFGTALGGIGLFRRRKAI